MDLDIDIDRYNCLMVLSTFFKKCQMPILVASNPFKQFPPFLWKPFERHSFGHW